MTTKFPWNKTANTPSITGIPPDIILLSELQTMRKEILDLKLCLPNSFVGILKKELDDRQVGGSAYMQSSEIMLKLDALLARIDSQEPTPEPAEAENEDVGTFVEEEDDVVLFITNESAADSRNVTNVNNNANGNTSANSRNRNASASTLLTAARDRIVRETTAEQMKRRPLSLGYHHGKLNPLPSSWQIPTGCTVIQLVNMWLLGHKEENIPPLGMMSPDLVKHFDKGGRMYSKMKQVMGKVEDFGRQEKVWRQKSTAWNGATITVLWSEIWSKLDPYLRSQSLSLSNSAVENRKSRQGQTKWRTCYNNMQKSGLFQGNRVRRKKMTH